jgi:hypothetical protein
VPVFLPVSLSPCLLVCLVRVAGRRTLRMPRRRADERGRRHAWQELPSLTLRASIAIETRSVSEAVATPVEVPAGNANLGSEVSGAQRFGFPSKERKKRRCRRCLGTGSGQTP